MVDACRPEARRQGCDGFGVSNFSVEQLRRAQAIRSGNFSAASVFTGASRDRRRDFALLPAGGHWSHRLSPMASGLLTGAMTRERAAELPKDDWRRGHPDFTEPNLSFNLALVALLRA